MKKFRRKSIFAGIALVLSLVLAVTAVFAWFIKEADIRGSIMVYSGNIDLQSGIFVGNDEEKDGTLERIDPEEAEPANREEALKAYYYVAQKDFDPENDGGGIGANRHTEVIGGTVVSYKAVFINEFVEDGHKTDARVSLSFSNLEDYFYEYLQSYIDNNPLALSNSEFFNMLGKNASRITFRVDSVVIRRYAAAAGEAAGGFERDGYAVGYNALVASSVLDETKDAETVAEGAENVDYVSTAYPDHYLWDVSKGEYFIEDVYLPCGELVEIDYRLTCLQMGEVLENYGSFVPTYQSRVKTRLAALGYTGDADALAASYVEDMMMMELEYIYGSDEESETFKQIQFTIDTIYATGKSVPYPR